MRTSSKRRLSASLAALAVTAGGLSLLPAPANADPAPWPVALSEADNWLGAVVDSDTGLLPGIGGNYDSIATTADAVKSFDELGAEDDARGIAPGIVDAAVDAIPDNDHSSQESAQGLWASQLIDDQSADLLTDVESHLLAGGEEITYTDYLPPTWEGTQVTKTADPATAGRLYDTTFSTYTGTAAQGWAALALERAGSDKADAALAYLLEQQCDAGWFRSKFAALDATDQSCDAGDPSSDPDLGASVDATAQSIIALSDLPQQPDAVTAAVTKAAAWLVSAQAANGSFSEYYGVSGNSTGLAGRALRLTGHAASATKAAQWLRRHQAVSYDACPTKLDQDYGAISYDDDSFATNQSKGITTYAQLGSAVSVTAQSLAALASLPLGNPKPVLSGPTTPASGAKIALTFKGGLPTDGLCLTVGNTRRILPAGTTSASIVVPTGVASTAISVQTASGAKTTTTLKINTAARLKVTTVKKVKRGKRLKVTVKGLWAGEKVTIKLGKATFGTATANKAGTAALTKKVSKKTKVRKQSVVVTGKFANRTGKVTVKVTR